MTSHFKYMGLYIFGSPCRQMCSATSSIKHNYHLCPHRSPFILHGSQAPRSQPGFEPTFWWLGHQNTSLKSTKPLDHDTPYLRTGYNYPILAFPSQADIVLPWLFILYHSLQDQDSRPTPVPVTPRPPSTSPLLITTRQRTRSRVPTWGINPQRSWLLWWVSDLYHPIIRCTKWVPIETR